MRKYPFYQVDAFTSTVFGGNPAGVVLLDSWLPDEQMQAIAAENYLPETAFVIPENDDFGLRWFTPKTEIDLCGHATLAAAFVLFQRNPGTRIQFQTVSGVLSVRQIDGKLELDFPSRPPHDAQVTIAHMAEVMGQKPELVLTSRDLFVVYENEETLRLLQPDFQAIQQLDHLAVIVTAPGDNVDFVSRFFAPKIGIPEDPVTGSAHCSLIPYWAKRLGKSSLHALQLSPRGGELFCVNLEDRVLISGTAVTYLVGEISLGPSAETS